MIYGYELKKLRNTTKLHIIFLCVLILCSVIQIAMIDGQSKISSTTEHYYKEYMKQLEGPITEDKVQFIQDERAKIDEVKGKKQEMDELYLEGQISIEEYTVYNDEYIYVQSREESFARVEQVYENIKNNGGWFVYDTNWKLYFSSELYNSILVLLVIFGFTMYVGNEYQSGMWQYLDSTKHGREKTLMAKSMISVIGGLLMAAVFCLVRFLTFHFYADIPSKAAPMCSIEGFYHLDSSHKIGVFSLEIAVLQCAIVASVGFIAMFTAYMLRSEIIGMAVGAAICFLPFLFKNYAPKMYAFSFMGMINMGNGISVLEDNIQAGILMLLPLVISVLVIACICALKKYGKKIYTIEI